jgi:GNAT superfamily N-acetyltransferase
MCDGEAVGVTYGATSVPGIPWHDLVAPILGADHPALQDAWRLVELAVVPEAEGLGIGTRLHDAIVASQPNARLLVSTGTTNARARGIYERRGWHYILDEIRPPESSDTYVIMGKAARS